MWQIHGVKDCALTWGGLTGRWKQRKKPIVTTNCKKSAEAIVVRNNEGQNFRKCEENECN